MPKSSETFKEWHLLSTPFLISQHDFANRISGLMVVTPGDPINGPHCPKIKEPRGDIDKITAVLGAQGSNIEFFKSRATSSDAKLLAEKVASLWASKTKSHQQGISAPFFKRYGIPNAQESVLDVLNQKEPPTEEERKYIRKLRDWAERQGQINKKDEFHILVGYIVLVDPAMEQIEDKKKSMGGSADPGTVISSALGAPPNTVPLKVEGQKTTEETSGASGTYEGDYLVACSYLPVRKVGSTPLKKRNFWGAFKPLFSRPKTAWQFEVGIAPTLGNFEGPLCDGEQLPASENLIESAKDPVLGDIVFVAG